MIAEPFCYVGDSCTDNDQEIKRDIFPKQYQQAQNCKKHHATSPRQTAFLPQISYRIILIAFKYKHTLFRNVMCTGADKSLHQWEAKH